MPPCSSQVSQGWSLAGAPHGLRYAYDPDPDGSYTLLDRFARNVVTEREWPARLKWLRAAGVGSVIAMLAVGEGSGRAVKARIGEKRFKWQWHGHGCLRGRGRGP